MNESQYTGQLGRTLKDLRDRSALRKRMRRYVLLLLIALGSLLLTLLSGCATQAPPPCEPSPSPPPPVVVSPMPTTGYSQKAATLFERWQRMLTDAALTDKP